MILEPSCINFWYLSSFIFNNTVNVKLFTKNTFEFPPPEAYDFYSQSEQSASKQFFFPTSELYDVETLK